MLSLRKLRAALLIGAVVIVLMMPGCSAAGGRSADDPAGSARPGSGAGEAAADIDGDLTVYDCEGIKIGLPTKYLDQLIVKTDFAPSDVPAYGTRLISVSERASVEACRADTGEDVGGFLFSIEKLSRADYEQYVPYDHSGRSAFAKAGENYYIYSTATDVQFYRSGGEIDSNSADWKDWETLLDMGNAVRTDLIARNGFAAYSDDELYNKEFTYGGDHAYVKYYSYFTFDGTRREYDTLVLSQPVRKREGGIWCVERFFDEYGRSYLAFPGTDTIGAADVTAEEYYGRVQAECDAGNRSDVLTPLGAAMRFVMDSKHYGGSPPTDGSFGETDGLNTAYTATNSRLLEYIPALISGREVDPMELLSCLGGFTPDNWGVLGRSFYGSDWWPPLRAALEQAAVGDSQEVRDREMICLFLSYPKADGPIAEGLSGILLRQYRADGETFEEVLGGFSAAEQESIRGALEFGQN